MSTIYCGASSKTGSFQHLEQRALHACTPRPRGLGLLQSVVWAACCSPPPPSLLIPTHTHPPRPTVTQPPLEPTFPTHLPTLPNPLRYHHSDTAPQTSTNTKTICGEFALGVPGAIQAPPLRPFYGSLADSEVSLLTTAILNPHSTPLPPHLSAPFLPPPPPPPCPAGAGQAMLRLSHFSHECTSQNPLCNPSWALGE